MARKKPEPESVVPVPVQDARDLLTFEPGDSAWSGKKPKRKHYQGAVVRLKPPAGATDEQVEELRSYCETRGAAKIVVLPRPRANPLPAARFETSKSVGARAAVEQLVAESKTGEALAAFCESVMGEAGL